MAHKQLLIAASIVVGTSAANAQPMPSMAPPAPPGAKYCMHVGPITGSNVETVQCWTRDQWADQDVDVDQEWAKEGVAIIP